MSFFEIVLLALLVVLVLVCFSIISLLNEIKDHVGATDVHAKSLSNKFQNRVSENIADQLFRKDVLSSLSYLKQSNLKLEEIAKYSQDTRARVEAIERVVVGTHVERKEGERREALSEAMGVLSALETAAELNALVEKYKIK